MLQLYADMPYRSPQITQSITDSVAVSGKFSARPTADSVIGSTLFTTLSLASSLPNIEANLLCRRQLAHHLAALEPTDPFRHKHESLLLEKLYDMGILGTAGAGGRGKLSEVEKKVTVSSMCRRRLGVVMTRLKMADTVQAVCNSQLPSATNCLPIVVGIFDL